MKKYAVGTTAAWNLLSPAIQAMYEKHFENYALCAADGDFSGTLSEDYLVEQISELTQSVGAPFSLTTGVFTVTFDALNNILNDNYATYLIINNIIGNSVLQNFNYRLLIDKSTEYRVLLFLGNDNHCTFKNSVIDLNNKKGSAVYDSTKTITTFCMYNVIIKKTANTVDYGAIYLNITNLAGVIEIDNCTIIGSRDGVRITGVDSGGTVTLTNNYFDGSRESYPSTSVAIDGGGNTTSDTSAPEPARQNINPNDAFVDSINYIPNNIPAMQGVEPSFSNYLNGVTTTNNWWVGANGRFISTGSNSSKRKKRNFLTQMILNEL